MDKYHVEKIAWAVDMLNWLECWAKRQADKGEGGAPVPPDFQKRHVETVLARCAEVCHKLDMAHTLEMVEVEMRGYIESGQMTIDDFRHHLLAIRNSLKWEVAGRTFILIPQEIVLEVRKMNDSWVAIVEQFPHVKPDLLDATDSYAIGNNTAAVFHLMRVVEWGLRALCLHAGIRKIVNKNKKTGKITLTPIEYAVWETMLNQAESKIGTKIAKLKRGPTKQRAQELYLPLWEELHAFKDAWRNHVMHTRKNYIAADVHGIMSHVQRFMAALASNGICSI